jgi:D-sedoheptulose 7-phosphate isomerase
MVLSNSRCRRQTNLPIVMDLKIASASVVAALTEGADLRMKIGRENGPTIVKAALLIANCLQFGNKLLLFGNGGSAADAQHLAAEFVGRFVRERAGLPAIALTTDSSILTAVGNDYGFEQVFSRQIEALGRPNDVAIGISTSGNSANVIEGVKQASKQKLKTIGLTGKDGGAIATCVDLSITVACANTARIQECHITIGHILCELVETELCDK